MYLSSSENSHFLTSLSQPSFQSEQKALLICSHHSPVQVWLWLVCSATDSDISSTSRALSYLDLYSCLRAGESVQIRGGREEIIPPLAFFCCCCCCCWARVDSFFLHLYSSELKLSSSTTRPWSLRLWLFDATWRRVGASCSFAW